MGVGRGLEARQEAECMLHVEGGDGDVGRCGEGNHCTGGQDEITVTLLIDFSIILFALSGYFITLQH